MTDHTIASAITASLKKHKRKAADFYPTPFDVTEALMRFLAFEDKQYIWEPACGDGAISRVLKAHGHEVYSTDLRKDSGYGQEGGLDFLAFDPAPETGIPISAVYNDWIITNPPFKVADGFIKKALSITPNVALLLKATYWHAKRREPLFREHPPAWVLPLTWRPAFLEAERGKSPLMEVSWFVWNTENLDSGTTLYKPLLRPSTYRVAPPEPDNDNEDLFGDLLGDNSTEDGSDDFLFGEL